MVKKAEVIRKVEGGRLQSEVAWEFRIHKQIISDYLKHKDKILEAAEQASAGTQINFWDGSHPKPEALSMWLSATVAKKIPASGDLLRHCQQTIAPCYLVARIDDDEIVPQICDPPQADSNSDDDAPPAPQLSNVDFAQAVSLQLFGFSDSQTLAEIEDD
ncbi:hypothetical protein HPB51_006087 [Rhipicephalus microplus]|uniref:HTH psq-type domain-containing protein n=1 Tax=Rhipicephalus microplus TaxID=6941 RepID=A0A9J6EFP6_RHIMP|nr:hypothetical protein HPB51_006087 [Rhipicephalus microplus]